MDEILEYKGPDHKSFDKIVKQLYTGLNSKENESLLNKKLEKILISDKNSLEELFEYLKDKRVRKYKRIIKEIFDEMY